MLFYRRTVVRALFCKHKLFIAGVRGVVLDFFLEFLYHGTFDSVEGGKAKQRKGREEISTFISSNSHSGGFILI